MSATLTQMARTRHSRVGCGSKVAGGPCTHVGTRNRAPIWAPRLVHCFALVQTCGTPMYQERSKCTLVVQVPNKHRYELAVRFSR